MNNTINWLKQHRSISFQSNEESVSLIKSLKCESIEFFLNSSFDKSLSFILKA